MNTPMSRKNSRSLVVGIVAGAALLSAAGPAEAGGSASSASVIKLTNIERARHGCPALREDSRLNIAATGHARDMSARNYLSHTSKNGRSWSGRIRAAGYRDPGGENIARGFGTARAVVSAWMRSPEHRANILRCSFRRIGIGHAPDGGYWVQDFGY